MTRFIITATLASMLFLTSCGKGEEDDDIKEKQTASLVVKVIHVDGSNVIGAKVLLFETAIDYQNNANSIKTLETDELGDVYFKDLELKQYWFIATYEKYSNATSVSTTGRKLTADERMEKTTQLRP